jgi:hypothetical protein
MASSKRVGQIRQQHADREGAVGLEPPGQRVRLVAQILGGSEHTLDRLVVNQRSCVFVDGSRCRRRMDPGPVSDITQGHASSQHVV